MRKVLTVLALGGALVVGHSAKASAASFTFNFCPAAGGECTEDGITVAQLKFDEVLSGSDVNDYTLTATITGGDANSFIDELEFSISNLQYPADFTALSITGSPAGTSYTGPFADNVPGCSVLPLSGNDPCFNSTGLGAAAGPGITNVFTFAVNLAGNTLIAANTAMNFRFELEFADGSNAGIFSPNGVYNTTTTDTTTTDGSTVPEPATLLLFGGGLALAGRRIRRALAS